MDTHDVDSAENRLHDATKSATDPPKPNTASSFSKQPPSSSPVQNVAGKPSIKNSASSAQTPLPNPATLQRQIGTAEASTKPGSTHAQFDLFDMAAAIDMSKKKIMEENEQAAENDDYDEGWESDLNIDAIVRRKSAFSAGGVDVYLNSCKMLGIVPVSVLIEKFNLGESDIILKHRGLGPKGAQAIASVLENNTSIARLDLTNNWIESGGAFIGRSLQINRTLVFLNLSDNKLGLLGGLEMAEMLGYNGTLKTLILKGNDFGDKEAIHISEGLKQNSSLQVLDLSHNRIGDLGAVALGTGIAQNDGLKELNLGWNQIRVRGASGFFATLKDNLTLASLNMQDNGICDSPQPVALFISKSSVISNLNLSRTHMNDASLVAIARAAEQSYTLTEIDVSGNSVGDIGVLALFKAVATSNSIKRVVLRGVRMTRDTRVKMEELKTEKSDVEFVE
ncbi:hypothetical protein HDU84_004247 [Entophlyctis sp. JEL0112]|nr:hypothetical protein HDU84_004247 [Entophlyctis sp. JEL0112]